MSEKLIQIRIIYKKVPQNFPWWKKLLKSKYEAWHSSGLYINPSLITCAKCTTLKIREQSIRVMELEVGTSTYYIEKNQLPRLEKFL
jgi:hypothetical protein